MVAGVSWAVCVCEEFVVIWFYKQGVKKKGITSRKDQGKGWCLGREISVLFFSHRSTTGSIRCDF